VAVGDGPREQHGAVRPAVSAPPRGVRFLPNAITVLAFCSGLTAVYLALRGLWLYSGIAIGIAAICDSLDGPAARLLRATSRMGAQLDSLSDSVSFGVAPALVVYVWGLNGSPPGWAACLVFAVCAALRLARFNSLLDDTPRPWGRGFFTGVPAPGGGLMAIVPMILTVRLGDGPWSNQWVVGCWLVLTGLLMVSRLPTIALKAVRVSQSLIVPLLVLMVAVVALLIWEPELTFAIGVGVYLLHLPYAGWKFSYLKHHPELWEGGYRVPRPRAPRRRTRLGVRPPRVAGRFRDGSPIPRQRRSAPLRTNPRRRPR
jgi:CDP-diacylglycerol--serine O-phosphatidyltransferase